MSNLSSAKLSSFFSQLHTLLKSGIPLTKALGLMKYDFLPQVIEKLNYGNALSIALPTYFPKSAIASINNAEQNGMLEIVLDQLAKHYFAVAQDQQRIKSALVYPCFVIILSFLSLLLIFMFVLPGFESLFVDMKVELPLITRLLLNFAKILPLIIVLLLIIIFVIVKNIKEGRLDAYLIRLRFILHLEFGQFFHNLGFLLTSNIPMEKALGLSTENIQNTYVKNKFIFVQQAIIDGGSLSSALSNEQLLPKETLSMLEIGESSGELGVMLLNISSMYQDQQQEQVKRFLSLLEPMLTLIVGLFVALIALTLFLPILNMISQIQ